MIYDKVCKLMWFMFNEIVVINDVKKVWILIYWMERGGGVGGVFWIKCIKVVNFMLLILVKILRLSM